MVDSIEASAYRIPTEVPEADGTLTWEATTMVVVRAWEGGAEGLGWTYADDSCASLVNDFLAPVVKRHSAQDAPRAWQAMQHSVRNLGRPGLVSCAMSAVDVALWDLSARIAGLPLCRMLGRVHDSVAVYASGGFTTYDEDQLTRHVQSWVFERGIPRIKIKIGESWGRREQHDVARIRRTYEIAGPSTELLVDANGGYSVGQAQRVGARLGEWGVTWFEEPVSSDDLPGLAAVRRATSADVTAGEYGYDLVYFSRMLAADAVDCLQVDVTRCGGFTEWRRIAALAAAHNRAVSAHGAPNLSAHAGVSTAHMRHLEWFHDHDRIESMLLDGALDPSGGQVTPDLDAPGHGLTWRAPDAERYRVR